MPVVETVDVLLFEADFVPLTDNLIDDVVSIVRVVVLEPLIVAVSVGLALLVLEDPRDLEILDDAVPVFDDVIEPVLVLVTSTVPESLADFENEGDADAVLERAPVRVEVGLDV